MTQAPTNAELLKLAPSCPPPVAAALRELVELRKSKGKRVKGYVLSVVHRPSSVQATLHGTNRVLAVCHRVTEDQAIIAVSRYADGPTPAAEPYDIVLHRPVDEHAKRATEKESHGQS